MIIIALAAALMLAPTPETLIADSHEADMVAAKDAWWQRVMRRVKEKEALPLGAYVAPFESEKWRLLPDVTARVSVGGLVIFVDYVGAKTTSSFQLVALPDWVSLADPRLVALRLNAPGSKKARVCPFVSTEQAKKDPSDLTAPSFTLVGPCYSGLTKELFRAAKSDGVGLSAYPDSVTRDGWVHLKVNDERLLILTAPAPNNHPDAWVRVDSDK